MAWVVGLMWGVAVLIGIVVLGLCAFDLAGKRKRLDQDAQRLLILRSHLSDLQERVVDARQRLPNRPGR